MSFDSKNTYLIYRSRVNGLITKYQVLRFIPPDLELNISKFNETDKLSTVEVTDDKDLKTLISISEANKKIRQDDIRSIQQSFDHLQDELYRLTERVNNEPT